MSKNSVNKIDEPLKRLLKTHLEEQVLNSPVNVVHFELRIADEVPVQGQHGVDDIRDTRIGLSHNHFRVHDRRQVTVFVHVEARLRC